MTTQRKPGRPKKVIADLDATVENAALEQIAEFEEAEKEAQVYRAFTVKSNGSIWWAVQLMIERKTNKVVKETLLTPGTSRTNAILALDRYQMKLLQGPPGEFVDETI